MAGRYSGHQCESGRVNGKRAAIIDMKATDPEGWAQDKRPALASPADAVIYEMHHRDSLSILHRAFSIKVNSWH